MQYIAEGVCVSMKEVDEKLKEMHMGRIIHMLSHQMKRNCNNVDSAITNDDLTVMQKHVLKFASGISSQRSLPEGHRRRVSDQEIYGDRYPEAHGESWLYQKRKRKEGCQTETNCPDCEGRRDTAEDSGADSEDRGEIAGRNPTGECNNLQTDFVADVS